MISRRLVMGALGAALVMPQLVRASGQKAFGAADLTQKIAALEARSGGRLGVAVIDTGTGARFAHRGGERFPMCSTFKFLLAAAVLAEADRGHLKLTDMVPITRADLIAYAPEVEKHVGSGMSLSDLCAAAVIWSDNGAANLLLRQIGGPAAVTRFLRSAGDPVTRLDRAEPELNVVPEGSDMDTTTPDAVADDMVRLVLGDVLAPASRGALKDWLIGCRTGDKRLRAGLPKGWTVGDKTGTGPARTGTSNDVAIAWPPGRAPLVITSYLTASRLDGRGSDAIHADVARAVTAGMAG
ncbi:class A beta-lactamase [Azorhizobium caulinodans]|uniref:class A beta-lactamase n=1 Tax=Azorhizobium caulinodans TaxID=7 RepID=UPI002FBDF904